MASSEKTLVVLRQITFFSLVISAIYFGKNIFVLSNTDIFLFLFVIYKVVGFKSVLKPGKVEGLLGSSKKYAHLANAFRPAELRIKGLNCCESPTGNVKLCCSVRVA